MAFFNKTESMKYIYSIPIPETDSECSTCVRRCYQFPDELISNFEDPCIENAWDIFKLGLNKLPDAPCLGSRRLNSDNKLGDYVWKTYREVEEIALSLGCSLSECDFIRPVYLDDVYSDPNLNSNKKSYKFLGLYSKNREEWIFCEESCNLTGIIIVPIYDTFGDEAMAHILQETKMSCVAVSGENAVKMLNFNLLPDTFKSMIIFDPVDENVKAKAKASGIELIDFNYLVQQGRKIKDKENYLCKCRPKSSDINTICYTSGTTSLPKGVILTHLNFVSVICAIQRGVLTKGNLEITNDEIHISYLPLAHILERFVVNAIFANSARIGFYSGDIKELFNDIKILKPTIFVSVPRMFNRIVDKIEEKLREKPAVLRWLFNQVLNSKISTMRQGGSFKSKIWDNLLFKKIRDLLGGNVRYMVSGSAPLDPIVNEKMKAIMSAPLVEGYGMTETMGASLLTNVFDNEVGHIGGPVPSVEFKIISAPDLGYYVDDPDGSRGQLLLRGPCISPGYFRNHEETMKSFIDEFICTGDIVQLRANGSLVVIDRVGNHYKLSQGEFVAPEKIENIYSRASFVSQIFVFGQSKRSSLVAVVVPDPDPSLKWAEANKIAQSDYKSLCANTKFRAAVFDSMNTQSIKDCLKGFERVKDIYLSSESFNIENHLLTPTFKLKRQSVYLHFKDEIEKMYENLEKSH